MIDAIAETLMGVLAESILRLRRSSIHHGGQDDPVKKIAVTRPFYFCLLNEYLRNRDFVGLPLEKIGDKLYCCGILIEMENWLNARGEK